MSTLKVNKLRDTAGSADAITLDPNGGAVLAGVTTATSVKVGAAVTISESGIEASGIGITCANINGTQIGGRRNLVINGAMMVAQRGTSDTSTNGIGTVDRFHIIRSGVDENPTQQQVDVSSGTTPYTLGFRKAFKVTNGDQSNGAGTSDYITMRYKIEAQDIANSGWNYTSATSFVTLSFWVKSSVAQNFYGYLYSHGGTAQAYPFETGSLTSDTWKKVVLKIPGNSNLQFDNDNDVGLDIYISQFWGTDRTDSGKTLNSWASYNGAARTPDFTSTWYTTNDAAFELTGLQLEVGSQVTPFEHRRFGEELLCCQRYYVEMGGGNYGDYAYMTGYMFNNGNNLAFGLYLPCAMRATPTIAVTGNLNVRESGNTVAANSPAIGGYDTNSNWIACSIGMVSDMGSNGDPATLTNTNNAGITLDAEL